MEPVIVAIGSNLGDRLSIIQQTGVFLDQLSERPVEKASIWESEPVGPSKFQFYNTAAKIYTSLSPPELLVKLKKFEQKMGREENPERWGPRILDLDIIRYSDLVIQTESLIIPHPEYSRRLFVLLPMQEVDPNWLDPTTGKTLSEVVKTAPEMKIHKTEHRW
ncbi:MAG: 2-amino-4-hydroxy-6-hydroxymethyldihydropteridine diphosphokinase [Balneolaceae bacterium]